MKSGGYINDSVAASETRYGNAAVILFEFNSEIIQNIKLVIFNLFIFKQLPTP